MDEQEFHDLLNELKKLNGESEISEFKINNSKPNEIGDYLSALSNSAALHDRDCAYLIFGVNDDGEVVGTKFNPGRRKRGQEIKNFLATQLDPEVNFEVHKLQVTNKTVVVFVIPAATVYPVKFSGKASIRVGSYIKPLVKHPAKEKALWQKLDKRSFEVGIAKAGCDTSEVIASLNCGLYRESRFEGMSSEATLDSMQRDGLLERSSGRFNITNLGAILFANDLSDFPSLEQRIPRLIIHNGKSRVDASREIVFRDGYAKGLRMLIDYILRQIPANEEISRIFRREHPLYPEVAIRELVVNALIHQDFKETGHDIKIEIFEDRIEIRNPGEPLVPTSRFVDGEKSRNNKLAREARRLGFCEDRGSGIDRVVTLCEIHQLPAPLFDSGENHTIVILYAPKEFGQMDMVDKVRAAYLHACLRFVNNKPMTNQSLRERFKIDAKNYPQVSRIVKKSIQEGAIKFKDPGTVTGRYVSYVPFWAK